jgi:hypothetical protein
MSETIKKRWFLFLMLAVTLLLLSASLEHAIASQSSENYAITLDVLSGGGGECNSSNYYLYHTTGQNIAIGISSSTNYLDYAGFWDTVIQGTYEQFLGDVNNDGAVDISDVILVLRIALVMDPQASCSDINGDGNVDISDVILTLRMALGLDPLQPCTD